MLERRKIQRTGTSSYIVTLPKDWIDTVGLRSGDYVYIYEYKDKLIITPLEKGVKHLKGEIRVHKPIDNEQIFRVLVGMYLSGYNNVVITFDQTIPNLAKRINEIKNRARIKLAGIEVVDETSNSISFRILLSIKELPLIHAIRRLHLIVNNMLRDSLEAFKNNDRELAETVIQRDDEADRFHFMIIRQLSQALLDIQVMHELGVTNSVEILNYRIIARNLERIADHTVNIARRTFYREDPCVLCNEVYEIGVKINSLFNRAMEGFYKLSRHISEEVIETARVIVGLLEETLKEKILLGDIKSSEKILLTMIFDSLRRITRYSNGIAETTLNIKANKSTSHDIK